MSFPPGWKPRLYGRQDARRYELLRVAANERRRRFSGDTAPGPPPYVGGYGPWGSFELVSCHSGFRCRQLCVLMEAKQQPPAHSARSPARGDAVFAKVDWAAPIENQKSKR